MLITICNKINGFIIRSKASHLAIQGSHDTTARASLSLPIILLLQFYKHVVCTLKLLVLKNTNQWERFLVILPRIRHCQGQSAKCAAYQSSLSLVSSLGRPASLLVVLCSLLSRAGFMSEKYLLCSHQYNTANNGSSPRDTIYHSVSDPQAHVFTPKQK